MKGTEAYDIIKRQVIRQRTDEHVFMSENSLSEQLGISRTPIRKALIKLEEEGFITILPHQGITLKPLSYEEARSLFELRDLVEDYLIEHSIQFITPEDISYLRTQVTRQEKVLEKGDYDSYFDLDDAFHLFCYRYANNDQMRKIVKNCKDRFYRYRYLHISKPGQPLLCIQQHKEFLSLLEEGKTEEAKDTLRKHIWHMEEQINNRSFQFI